MFQIFCRNVHKSRIFFEVLIYIFLINIQAAEIYKKYKPDTAKDPCHLAAGIENDF